MVEGSDTCMQLLWVLRLERTKQIEQLGICPGLVAEQRFQSRGLHFGFVCVDVESACWLFKHGG